MGALLMLSAPQAASAMGPHGPGRMGPPPMGSRLLKLLDLTPAQQKKAIRIRAKMQADLVDVHEKIRTKHKELHKLWAQENPDLREIMQKFDELQPLMKKVFERRARMRLEFRSILTDEQKERLLDFLKNAPPFFDGDGPGPGHGPRRGKRGLR